MSEENSAKETHGMVTVMLEIIPGLLVCFFIYEFWEQDQKEEIGWRCDETSAVVLWATRQEFSPQGISYKFSLSWLGLEPENPNQFL